MISLMCHQVQIAPRLLDEASLLYQSHVSPPDALRNGIDAGPAEMYTSSLTLTHTLALLLDLK